MIPKNSTNVSGTKNLGHKYCSTYAAFIKVAFFLYKKRAGKPDSWWNNKVLKTNGFLHWLCFKKQHGKISFGVEDFLDAVFDSTLDRSWFHFNE